MKDHKIKVIIVDDHAILRVGINQIILATDDIEVIAEAPNGTEAIKLARELNADVMLLDISLPDRSGMDVLKYVKGENSHIAVLMLSTYMEDQYAVRALKSGAAGYLCKQSASTDLLNAIRTVAKGKKFITPEVAEILADQVGMEKPQSPHETLSDRDRKSVV